MPERHLTLSRGSSIGHYLTASCAWRMMMAGVGIRLICFIPATREDMLCGNERANAVLRPLFSEAPLSYSSEVQSR